ncbi:AAA family ATPase [Streptomyces sp. NPDC001340]
MRVGSRTGLHAAIHSRLHAGGSVVLAGPAGIGKTTVLRAAVAAESGRRPDTAVLSCSLDRAESGLPFLAIIDLLAGAFEAVRQDMPEPQCAVLRSVLIGDVAPAAPRGRLALRLAVLSALRALAARGPVLLAVDDVPWMDQASAELLAFATRRLSGGVVRMLATVRTESESGDEARRWLAIAPVPAELLTVPPLNRSEAAHVIGPGLSGALVREIHRVSGGNPLYAGELARSLRGRPLPPYGPLPVPDSLRGLVLERVRRLPPDTRKRLLLVSAAVRPRAQDLGGRDAWDSARAAGVVELDEDGVVRFTHPLLAAAVYDEAGDEERRGAHAELARTVTDPVERGRHLALASPGPDEAVAAALDAAARSARRRGAPALALELGLLAVDRTLRDSTEADVLSARLLNAAEDAIAAGSWELAGRTARQALAISRRRTDRVRAWTVVLNSAGQALGDADVAEALRQAFTEAGDDPALLAPLHYWAAARAIVADGNLRQGMGAAARAAALAAVARDRHTEVLALSMQALMETLLGEPGADTTLARASAEPRDPAADADPNGPRYVMARHDLIHDRVGEARVQLTDLLALAESRGDVQARIGFTSALAEVELRAGQCARALQLAREAVGLAEDSGIGEGAILPVAALAEAAAGSPDTALALAERGRRHSEEAGDRLFLCRSLHALGHAALLAGDAPRAVGVLARAWDIERAQGVVETARGRWHADLVEALALTGRCEEALRVLEVTREAATARGRTGVLALLDHAEGLVRAAQGELDAAADRVRDAARRLAVLGSPVEEGRSHLALAGIERRRGDREAVVRALEDARRAFRRAGAVPWLGLAEAELGRVSRTPVGQGPDDPLCRLTERERSVSLLIADGASNREAAARLFVSEKTVEAALTRVYRKLGLRSRGDVIRAVHRSR